jgi:hypothetical protein
LLRKIKILAAREDTSISALMTELLEEQLKKDQNYEAAKRRGLARLRKGYVLGFKRVPRGELHER